MKEEMKLPITLKISINAIYGISTNISPKEYTIEDFDAKTFYYLLNCSFSMKDLAGNGNIIMTENQLDEIIKGLDLRHNVTRDNVVYFIWENGNTANENKLATLKLKAEYLFNTTNDNFDPEENAPEDYNHYLILR